MTKERQSHIRVFESDRIMFKRKREAFRRKTGKMLGEAEAFRMLVRRKKKIRATRRQPTKNVRRGSFNFLPKGKRGLSSILVIMVTIQLFLLVSLFMATAWSKINDDGFQIMDNETVRPQVKEKINDLSKFIHISDRVFMYFFIVLIIAYLISTITLPVDKIVFFFVFTGNLIFITLFAMINSNTWAYLIQNPNFIVAATHFGFATYVMRYYPIIMFLVGMLGAVIFYSRVRSEQSPGDFIE